MMSQPLNFGRLPRAYADPEKAAIVVVPVAYDATSTWIKGAQSGPQAILQASAHMELYDIETDSQVYKRGIFTDSIVQCPASPQELVRTVAEKVGHYLSQNKFVVVIGGEHSVSIGSVKAHAEKYHSITVLQLDAHCDLRNEYNGSKYNHACVMARVREICPVVQVGIRSMDFSEKAFIDKDNIFFAKDICDNNHWVEDVIPRLSDNVYVTVDLDVFDPCVMPSVGTPEPGGLFWYDVLALLRTVCRRKNVIGFDVVELCPNESSKAPDFCAAKLIYKLLSYRFGESYDKKGFS